MAPARQIVDPKCLLTRGATAALLVCTLALCLGYPRPLAAGETESPRTESTPRLQLRGGPFVGWRHFRATRAGRNALYLDGPLFGIDVEGVYRLTHPKESQRFHIDIISGGSYAPVSWGFSGDNRPNLIADGHHISGHLLLGMNYDYLPGLSAVGRVGIWMLSEFTEPNPYYTGTRYLGTRATVGIRSAPIEPLRVTVLAGVLPTPVLNHSGGSRGESPFALGWTGSADITLDVTSQLRASVSYVANGFQVTWKRDRRPDVRTLDIHHRWALNLGADF